MIPPLVQATANHLWQSTWFGAAAALIACLLRRNHSRVRHAVWLAASVKFLIPFSLLVSAGSRVAPLTPLGAPPSAIPAVIESFGEPFAAGSVPGAVHQPLWPAILAGLWIMGSAAMAARWWTRWGSMRAMVRGSVPLRSECGVLIACGQSKASARPLEPGVFGIFRPVLILPEPITSRLSPEQLAAVIAHEMCHVRHRDNLAAAVHMLVEVLFWFHPLVWWIGQRMVDERERACDEEVLRLGNAPQTYAESILSICRLCVESPLPCASGVTGADLNKRIEAIMTHPITRRLTFARKLLLASAGIAAIAAPILVGTLHPPRIRAQEPNLVFEVASIKPSNPNENGGWYRPLADGGVDIANMPVRTLIVNAYQVLPFQVVGGPNWLDSARFDVLARPGHVEGPADSAPAAAGASRQNPSHRSIRLRALLAERFHLAVHRESRDLPVYLMVAARNGPKLQQAKADEVSQMRSGHGELEFQAASMGNFAKNLANRLGRIVIDRTGLTGAYDFKLQWTPESTPPSPRDPDSLIPPDPSGPSIFSALQEQLGLRLQPGKGPVELIVIDRIEKPTEN